MIRSLFLYAALLFASTGHGQGLVSPTRSPGAFTLFSGTERPVIVYDAAEDSLVHISARLLAGDLERLGAPTPLISTTLPSAGRVILIGTTTRSTHLRRLTASRALNAPALRGAWEGYRLQVLRQPFPGITEALVIAGSDRRGAAYGVAELVRQAGVSPWHWWADVPVARRNALYVRAAGAADAPRVRYRGLFINDEAPALSTWSREQFGGFNHRFYEKVFELMLRLKANYLWPAMWGSAFYADDPLNRQTADNWGIVIGTSHHEPLMRAHDEWRRAGGGRWNYDSNAARLRHFWKTGLERASNEKIVTVGMRGDGDEPMSEQTATALLERIVKDQRQIISDVTGRPASETPQLWALYKEVQDYYDKGMRVPDDVTLLLCDDNWGNIRRLPRPGEKPRKGGYGIYYHFDYVGGPRNYKWLNTNNLARVWEQMNLAWNYGARQIWIVNVGDIKPMELPLSFFMDQAWNPERFTARNIDAYYERWAGEQFGSSAAKSVGGLLRTYSQLSARRKPELLDADTYSLTSTESAGVVAEWEELQAQADAVAKRIPARRQDAFFQLVQHPVTAFANLHRLYRAVALNHSLAAARLSGANRYADEATEHYRADSLLTLRYHALGGGKWNGMMAQTHIGYTYWQQPERNSMPALQRVSADSAVSASVTVDTALLAPPPVLPPEETGKAFFQRENYVSIGAAHPGKMRPAGGMSFQVIPGIGRTGDGITTVPVTKTAPSEAAAPFLEYVFYTSDSGLIQLQAHFSPTLNLFNNGGLRFAVAIDDAPPQLMTLNADDHNTATWERWVAHNIIIRSSTHRLTRPGRHRLRYYARSPAIVLQHFVLHFSPLAPSYLPPAETR